MDWMNVGIGRHMLRLPQTIGRRRVASVAKQAHDVMAGLTDQHRTLHRLMFAELVRVATPLTPETLAEHMHVSVETVGQMLAEIGEQKALIARDKSGSVSWVYPVTVDQTPHRLTFRSGEQLYAA